MQQRSQALGREKRCAARQPKICLPANNNSTPPYITITFVRCDLNNAAGVLARGGAFSRRESPAANCAKYSDARVIEAGMRKIRKSGTRRRHDDENSEYTRREGIYKAGRSRAIGSACGFKELYEVSGVIRDRGFAQANARDPRYSRGRQRVGLSRRLFIAEDPRGNTRCAFASVCEAPYAEAKICIFSSRNQTRGSN